MRVIKAILAAATLLAGFTFNAKAADPIEGKDYAVISPALQNDSPGKIEVTEFFWYGCSHCFHFENPLGNWAKTAPKDVVLRYIPAPLNPTWTPGARLYYALDALGAETRLRHDVFDAIHNQHSLFPTDESAFPKWVAGKGVGHHQVLRGLCLLHHHEQGAARQSDHPRRRHQRHARAGCGGQVQGRRTRRPLCRPTGQRAQRTGRQGTGRTASSNDRVGHGARHPRVHVGVPRFGNPSADPHHAPVFGPMAQTMTRRARTVRVLHRPGPRSVMHPGGLNPVNSVTHRPHHARPRGKGETWLTRHAHPTRY